MVNPLTARQILTATRYKQDLTIQETEHYEGKGEKGEIRDRNDSLARLNALGIDLPEWVLLRSNGFLKSTPNAKT